MKKPSKIFEGENSSLRKTFDEATMTPSKQLSVRERAREMFDKKIRLRHLAIKPDEIVEQEIDNFIDQIITLAIEEKIKVIEQLAHNETGLMPEMGIFDSGYELAKEDVIKILKQ